MTKMMNRVLTMAGSMNKNCYDLNLLLPFSNQRFYLFNTANRRWDHESEMSSKYRADRDDFHHGRNYKVND